MARHKLSYSGERLTTGLYVQLTPTQQQHLHEAVRAQGARLSDYVRAQLFRKEGQAMVEASTGRNPQAKALLDELRRIGNNLNQLSHHANADGQITEQRELHEAIMLLKAAMARVLAL
jgi:cell wall assembly regulator SMI1